MRAVAIISLATAASSDFACGPYQGEGTSEFALAKPLVSSLDSVDLLVADRYYCSYFFVALLQDIKINVVTNLHGARKCYVRIVKHLGSGDHLITLIKPPKPVWIDKGAYDYILSTLTVKEVKPTKENGDDIVLVTTLIYPKTYPRTELASVYIKRWNIVLDFRPIKSVMGMDILSCKTPNFPIRTLCKALDVSESGFHAWKGRPESNRSKEDRVLTLHVKAEFERSRKSYGTPRIKMELDSKGIPIGKHKAAKLMREAGIKARDPVNSRLRPTLYTSWNGLLNMSIDVSTS